MKKHTDSGLWVRDNADIGVIKQQSSYRELKGLNLEGKTCLDLGGYIGTFAWWALKNLDLKKIVSVEPEPSNVKVFQRNFGGNRKVKLLIGAVGEKVGGAKLYLGKKYRSCNSLQEFRGRKSISVTIIPFRQLLLEVHPTLIKCDIEGGEYFFSWKNLPTFCKVICMELHQQKKGWFEKQQKLDEVLLDQNFEHIKPPSLKVTFQKVCVAIWRRL